MHRTIMYTATADLVSQLYIILAIHDYMHVMLSSYNTRFIIVSTSKRRKDASPAPER